jgi:hypothetical protein
VRGIRNSRGLVDTAKARLLAALALPAFLDPPPNKKTQHFVAPHSVPTPVSLVLAPKREV